MPDTGKLASSYVLSIGRQETGGTMKRSTKNCWWVSSKVPFFVVRSEDAIFLPLNDSNIVRVAPKMGHLMSTLLCCAPKVTVGPVDRMIWAIGITDPHLANRCATW